MLFSILVSLGWMSMVWYHQSRTLCLSAGGMLIFPLWWIQSLPSIDFTVTLVDVVAAVLSLYWYYLMRSVANGYFVVGFNSFSATGKTVIGVSLWPVCGVFHIPTHHPGSKPYLVLIWHQLHHFPCLPHEAPWDSSSISNLHHMSDHCLGGTFVVE